MKRRKFLMNLGIGTIAVLVPFELVSKEKIVLVDGDMEDLGVMHPWKWRASAKELKEIKSLKLRNEEAYTYEEAANRARIVHADEDMRLDIDFEKMKLHERKSYTCTHEIRHKGKWIPAGTPFIIE